MSWWAWGEETAAHVVVCVHGLTRQGRDFDWLARALIERMHGQVRVICPDVAGRGHSDWLSEPVLYGMAQYASDMLAMLAAVHAYRPIGKLDWVGTSMGGLIGMVLAGQPQLPLPSPIAHLVLNDVGPAISWSSVQRMQQFVGKAGRFDGLSQAAAYLREVSQGFGPVPDDIWQAMSAHMVRHDQNTGVRLHYDPAIAEPIRVLTPEAAQAGETVMWKLYDQIQAKVLLLRGMSSDLLLPDTAQAMTRRGPRARLLEWPDVGHAPTLTSQEQTAAVVDFLMDAAA
jgi:pimeloyl-ACP methyl ester carboxylesterase